MRIRLVAVGILAALLMASLASAATDAGSARIGARWLARTVPGGADGQSADTAVALRAAGQLTARARSIRIAALRAGAARYATTPGAAAKVALALVALDADRPRCAGNLDLVARINDGYAGGRYGRTIFDQTLSMLAVHALGRPIPAAAVRTLRATRRDGGWGVLAGQVDDVSSTAMAVLALRAAGAGVRDAAIDAALRWIERERSPSGGFALGRSDRNESNSTALALEAFASVGRRDQRASRALQGLQRADGSFSFSATDGGSRVIASTDAVTAMAGRHLPVASLARPASGC